MKKVYAIIAVILFIGLLGEGFYIYYTRDHDEHILNTAEDLIEKKEYEKADELLQEEIENNDSNAEIWMLSAFLKKSYSTLDDISDLLYRFFCNDYSYYSNINIDEVNEYTQYMFNNEWTSLDKVNNILEIINEKHWLDNGSGLCLNDGSIKIYMDGDLKSFNTLPYMDTERGRVMIPICELAELLGWETREEGIGTLFYNISDNIFQGRNITIYHDSNKIMYVDNDSAGMEGSIGCTIITDVESVVIDGSLMAPVRLLTQITGKNVVWKEELLSVYITDDDSDEKLIDSETARFIGTLGSGQSDNYACDIDEDGVLDVICFGYHNSNTAIVTLYKKNYNGDFEVIEELKLIEVDDSRYKKLIDIAYKEEGDWIAKLKKEAEESKKLQNSLLQLHLDKGAPPQYGGMNYGISEETAIQLIKIKYNVDVKLLSAGTTMYTFKAIDGSRKFTVTRWYATYDIDKVEISG